MRKARKIVVLTLVMALILSMGASVYALSSSDSTSAGAFGTLYGLVDTNGYFESKVTSNDSGTTLIAIGSTVNAAGTQLGYERVTSTGLTAWGYQNWTSDTYAIYGTHGISNYAVYTYARR